MKKTSISTLYCFSMISEIFMLICGISGSIIVPIFCNDITDNVGKLLGTIFLIGIAVLFSIMALFSLISLIKLLKDLKSLKNNEYISIVGRVIAFKRNLDPESGIQRNDHPVIKIIESGNEIVLLINDKLTIDKIYKFNYLKHCKIAEVVDEM